MVVEVKDPANPNPDPNVVPPDKSLLEGGDKPAGGQKPEGSVLDQAAQDAKAAQEAEDKKLLETPDEQLDEAGKTKKAALVKAKTDAEAKAAADAKAKQVPEKYEFKIPEGMTLDQALVDKVTPVFKAKGFNQEQAQAVVDMYIETQNAATKVQEENYQKFLEDSKKETLQTLGAKYKEEIAYAVKIRSLFSEETRELISAAGLGDNKCFLLDLIKIGKMFSEAKLIDGRSAAGAGEQSPGSVIYPNQGKQ